MLNSTVVMSCPRVRQAGGPEALEEMDDVQIEQAVPDTKAPAVVDPRMLEMLGSLRRAAWFAVCILALIFVVILLQR